MGRTESVPPPFIIFVGRTCKRENMEVFSYIRDAWMVSKEYVHWVVKVYCNRIKEEYKKQLKEGVTWNALELMYHANGILDEPPESSNLLFPAKWKTDQRRTQLDPVRNVKRMVDLRSLGKEIDSELHVVPVKWKCESKITALRNRRSYEQVRAKSKRQKTPFDSKRFHTWVTLGSMLKRG